MREYLFRAKCIHESEYKGQLIYGFGVHNWDDDGIERAELYTPNGVFEVAPETVGQYTGLKDKNGKEIYEGDLLDISDRVFPQEVDMDDGCYGTEEFALFELVRNKERTIEVIGNRWDNTELLGEVRE